MPPIPYQDDPHGDDSSLPPPELLDRFGAWRVSAFLLVAMIGLDSGMVVLTRSQFGLLFFVNTAINVVLAAGLLQLRSWARVLTLLRAAVGILLALAVAVGQGTILDAAVTILLMAGISLPLVGPPQQAKTWFGALLFFLGVTMTLLAVARQWVVVG